jgi:glycosyltransferase involved in cell wall biosynthesis
MIFACTLALVCATIPAALFCANLLLYREPKLRPVSEAVSVLIPARNEERSICAAVESVLRSGFVEIEVIVLDDASTDRTAAIVGEIGLSDPRVRLEPAPPLPAGWNGKQHACSVLASLASHRVFCFLDADVRLEPEALARMVTFLNESHSELVSGFPYQQTVTPLEWLLLPLIHLVLLGFLPFSKMRTSLSPAYAAGCGQFMMVRREAYRECGGHAAIRSTMHDGLLLPRLFRSHGFRTDLADLTRFATCRMYRSAAEVWHGLAKNATEGLAAPQRIVPFTVVLFCGQVLPAILLIAICVSSRFNLHSYVTPTILVAVAAAYLPRILGVIRFRQSVLSAILHPLGITLMLLLQWYALLRKLSGRQATWKARAYDAG